MNYRQKEKKAKNNFRKLMSTMLMYKKGLSIKPGRVKIFKVAMTKHTYKVCAKAAGYTMLLCFGAKEEGNDDGVREI